MDDAVRSILAEEIEAWAYEEPLTIDKKTLDREIISASKKLKDMKPEELPNTQKRVQVSAFYSKLYLRLPMAYVPSGTYMYQQI